MKITDPQVIEDGEKDLIEAVQEDLDLDAVRQILKDRLEVSSLSSGGGQIVVHNNQIAFRMDFDIKLSGSLLFDREGNYIDDSGDDTKDDPILKPEMEPGGFDTPSDEASKDSLDELPLVETGLDETDLEQQDLDEEVIINLPEYDLEDEPMDTLGDEPMDTLEDEPMDTLEDEPIDTLGDDLENLDLENLDLENDPLTQEDMLDNDINDILKESREFWDQKKDS